jgi:hypothetical protein
MTTKIIAALTAILIVAGTATYAADSGFTLYGTAGIGGQIVGTSGTDDEGKLREYRDLTSGLLTLLDLKGRSSTYHLDFYAENLGRKDMFIDLRGGSYGAFKYRLFSDSLQHFFTTDARTPYSGAGTTTQRAVLPNLDPSTWNVYDLAYKRRNDGAMAEFSFNSPWYVRADVGQITFDGNKLQSFPQGTGSGNGFVDLAIPVDFSTRNLSLEGGYSSQRVHVALSYLDSKFDNNDRLLTWTNGYFGNSNPPATSGNLGIDTSYLANDSTLTRLAFNGVIKKLPLDSSLALRYTSSESKSDELLGTSQLIGSATAISTAPFLASPGTFKGKIKYDTWAASWSAAPTDTVDFRLWANDFKRENDSSHVVFSGFTTATNSLGCVGVVGGTGEPGTATGPRICENEPFTYSRSGVGGEVAWRWTRTNRLSAGYDEQKVDREFHPDSDSTKEKRYSLEWRNTSLDTLVASVKYLHLERSSNFLSPALPNTVWSFDVANVDRDVYKVGLDFTPSAKADFGAEFYYKQNKYKDSPSGRQADDRSEIYLSAGFGATDAFRFKVFADHEQSTTDARLRNRNSTTGQVNYTVFTGVDDKFDAAGVGFDWPAAKGLMIAGAASWNRSKGTVDFNGLAGAAALPTTLVDIPNYGNNERLALDLKGTYTLRANLDLTAGLAYEDAKFDDIQFDPYSYILPATPLVGAAQATASYLSGWYRDPAYKATIGYFMVGYKF